MMKRTSVMLHDVPAATVAIDDTRRAFGVVPSTYVRVDASMVSVGGTTTALTVTVPV